MRKIAFIFFFLLISPPAFAANFDRQMKEAVKKEEAGDYGAAQSIYKKILEKSPDYEPALMGLGYVHYWEGHYKEAADTFAKVLEHDSDHVGALVGSGKAWLAMGKQKKAQDFFNRVQKIEPEQEEVQAVAPQLERKTKMTLQGGSITKALSYAPDAQGEYQQITITKEKGYGFYLNSTYLHVFGQDGFDTRLGGHYTLFENTRIGGGLSFAPRTAVFPEQSYSADVAQTFWKITPNVRYTFEDYRQANLNSVRAGVFFKPLFFLKIGGGYEFQNLKFGATSRNFNNGFGEAQITITDWISLYGEYARVHRGFEAARTPSPFVNYKANVFGGGFELQPLPGYLIRFNALYEKRNNNETLANYIVSFGYFF